MRTRSKLGALALAALVAGCGDIIGLGGYTDAVEGGADAADGGGGGDTGADVRSDVAADATQDTGADAPIDTGADSCTPVAENCTNGADDDCDGQTDCQDSDCTTGYTCVPPLPNGWAWAIYDQDTRPACAAGYSTSKDVEEGINAGAATCGCSCGTTNPTCNTGNVTIHAGTGGGCSGVTNQTDPASAGCHALGTSFATNNQSIAVSGPAPSGGGCTPNATTSVPAVGYQHQGRTCAYAGAAGGGCTMSDVCMPKAAPFTACVSMAGMNACPSGFSVQHLTGSMLTDTRGCTSCTCSFNAGTCQGTATFYTNGGCSNNAQNVTADGACHGVANRTWVSYVYAPANAGVSCGPSSVSATGMAVFSDLTTVCCTN